ncbi:MAG: orotidine-5'-phosphate decarboxylase [Fimbriimonas sp.]|nr:orotidine-5'-phosphate decarboxylase [Fimbriimonas sp.]
MGVALHRQVICALDTPDIDEALGVVKRLRDHVNTFKIGHALTLPYGLDVLERLREAGATRIFLDLKFHDIPNSVALAVREAARRHVWMMTLHITGGPAMITAAVEEARSAGDANRPLLIGVSVLTSLDQRVLTDYLGVSRPIEEHMVGLSKLAIDLDLDGVVCSAQEVKPIRDALGSRGVIVTPGIRLPNTEVHDQVRVGDANSALQQGADYLVIGRALTGSANPEKTLEQFGLVAN